LDGVWFGPRLNLPQFSPKCKYFFSFLVWFGFKKGIEPFSVLVFAHQGCQVCNENVSSAVIECQCRGVSVPGVQVENFRTLWVNAFHSGIFPNFIQFFHEFSGIVGRVLIWRIFVSFFHRFPQGFRGFFGKAKDSGETFNGRAGDVFHFLVGIWFGSHSNLPQFFRRVKKKN
jgi:hypothetical protein